MTVDAKRMVKRFRAQPAYKWRRKHIAETQVRRAIHEQRMKQLVDGTDYYRKVVQAADSRYERVMALLNAQPQPEASQDGGVPLQLESAHELKCAEDGAQETEDVMRGAFTPRAAEMALALMRSLPPRASAGAGDGPPDERPGSESTGG